MRWRAWCCCSPCRRTRELRRPPRCPAAPQSRPRPGSSEGRSRGCSASWRCSGRHLQAAAVAPGSAAASSLATAPARKSIRKRHHGLRAGTACSGGGVNTRLRLTCMRCRAALQSTAELGDTGLNRSARELAWATRMRTTMTSANTARNSTVTVTRQAGTALRPSARGYRRVISERIEGHTGLWRRLSCLCPPGRRSRLRGPLPRWRRP